jgi:cytoskeleton protein RodZ
LAAALAFIGLAWWQPWDHRQRAKASSSAASTAAQARAAATGAEGDAMDGVAEPSADTPRAAAGVGNSGAAMNAGARTAASSGVGATAAATAGRAATDATPGRAATDATPGRAATDATAASPPARARLQLSFTSDSWVDVRDALGNQAFVGNGAANTVKTIAGAAPLHVYLRSASGVQLEINGRAVAIGAQFFSGDAARFQAGADGVLRREQTPARPPG